MFLRSLRGPALHSRAAALHKAGWPLAAIGEALDPPRPRSTVRTWVTRPLTHSPQTDILPLPHFSLSFDSDPDSSYSTLPAAEKVNPASSSSPTSSTAPAAAASTAASPGARGGALRVYDPEQPMLTPYARSRINELAPVARRYRSGMSEMSAPAQANMELTIVCRSSYTSGVSIRELALAAGVSYNAMKRRVTQ